MAQDDKGLVLRGFFLLALIGVLVTVVMAILFMRPKPAPPTATVTAENLIPLLVAGYPFSQPLGAAFALAERAPSAPGWDIRCNAATALARRGSAATPWPLMREMLDEKQQLLNATARQPDGKIVIDEAAARAEIIAALKALTRWHEKQTKRQAPPELRRVYAMVDKLAESSIPELKMQAEKARAAFFR